MKNLTEALKSDAQRRALFAKLKQNLTPGAMILVSPTFTGFGAGKTSGKTKVTGLNISSAHDLKDRGSILRKRIASALRTFRSQNPGKTGKGTAVMVNGRKVYSM